ncbi:hypothetical protein QQP08_007456 [Theobroma cacao]|nr:hypothetical protein QQP08_007456 [Theobroma cacao]
MQYIIMLSRTDIEKRKKFSVIDNNYSWIIIVLTLICLTLRSEGRQSRTKSLKQYLISGQVGFPLINGKPNEVTPLPSFSSSSFPFIISLFQFQHQPNPRPNLH